MVAKRGEVDAGNATVAELQIFYFQKDASSYMKSTNEFLDQAEPGKHESPGRTPRIG